MKMSDDLLEQLTNIRVENKKSLSINSQMVDDALTNFNLSLCKFADNHDKLVGALDEAIRSFKGEYNHCPPKWEEALKQAKGE